MILSEIFNILEVTIIPHGDSDEKYHNDKMWQLFNYKKSLKYVTTFGSTMLFETTYGWSYLYFFMKDDSPIGYALLDRREPEFVHSSRPIRTVTMIYITPEYYRNKIAFSFYQYLLSIYDLLSDTRQSENMNNMWNNLKNLSGFETISLIHNNVERTLIKKI